MTRRVLDELRGRRAATALAFLVASCASRAEPLALPAGHPADPQTQGSVVAANDLASYDADPGWCRYPEGTVSRLLPE